MWRTAAVGLILITFSCDMAIPVEPYENMCQVENPVNDLPWLKEMIASFEKSGDTFHFVQQCEFDGHTYFILNNCLDDNYIAAFDCDGIEICALSESTNCAAVSEKLIHKKIIWQAEYFDCR